MNPGACDACWTAFVQSLAPGDPRRSARPNAFAFGSDSETADELAALVLAGRKRATASLPVEYTALGEPLPAVGDLTIVLDGRGEPVAIVARTTVDVVPFHAVTAEFAAQEGEGDGSLAYWREAHAAYFAGVCAAHGGTMDEATPVICQRFELVWPKASNVP